MSRRSFALAVLVGVFLFLAYVAMADSPTIREVDRMAHFTDHRHEIDYSLRVFCDAPRGNIVYIADPSSGTSYEVPPTIAVIHQPDVCK